MSGRGSPEQVFSEDYQAILKIGTAVPDAKAVCGSGTEIGLVHTGRQQQDTGALEEVLCEGFYAFRP